MTCAGGELYGCLTLNEQHYCPGHNAGQFHAHIGFGVDPAACAGWLSGKFSGHFSFRYLVESDHSDPHPSKHGIAGLPRSNYLHEIELSARGAIASKAGVDPETVIVEPWHNGVRWHPGHLSFRDRTPAIGGTRSKAGSLGPGRSCLRSVMIQ